jgi:hypothetical protein
MEPMAHALVAKALGDLLAAGNATIQVGLAEGWGGNYTQAMAVVTIIVAIAVFSLTLFGPEAKGVLFARRAPSGRGSFTNRSTLGIFSSNNIEKGP